MARSRRADNPIPIVRPRGTVIEDPPLARALMTDVRLSWVWLAARVYVGWQMLEAGWTKLQSPEWMQGGAALRALWERALATDGPASSSGWYRWLLQNLLASESYTWVAKATAVSETLVGIALILGLMTGFAAFVGSLLGLNALVVGSGLVNPILFVLSIALVLAWKTAGWIGLDRWLLPLLGTPWRNGPLFQMRSPGTTSADDRPAQSRPQSTEGSVPGPLHRKR